MNRSKTDDERKQAHEETGMEMRMRMSDGYAQCSQQPISSAQNKQIKQLWTKNLNAIK